MSEVAESGMRRRRRADAERSITAILDAAAQVLGQRPEASMEDVARAAGTSRQTVYAHFPSRDALLDALLDRVTRRVLTAIQDADLETGPAGDALLRFLEISWQTFQGDPFLLHLTSPPATPEQEHDRHQPILGPLEQLIQRGQRSGEFVDLPTAWLIAATLALGHAAGEEVRGGRMSTAEAIDTLRYSIPRLIQRS